MSTLAKLYAADIWVVLDDVQFAARDYQHRCRLAELEDVTNSQWLSLRVDRPQGLSTKIEDVRLLEPEKCQRRTEQMLKQYYSSSDYWSEFDVSLQSVLQRFSATASVAKIAEQTTRELLQMLGWQGEIIRSSDMAARNSRSERLADLTQAAGCDVYLCGTGGAKYLDEAVFHEAGLRVDYFSLPNGQFGERSTSSLWAFMTYGSDRLKAFLEERR
jgi:hypothetical protein